MPKLLVLLPDSGEVSHDLTESVVTLGRLDENLLHVDDPSVSSRHAQLIVQESGNYLLRDLDSTNGTRVNGERITEAALRPGDQVRFGKIEAVYESDIPSTDAPTVTTNGKTGSSPGAATPTAAVAERSHRPADFANAAPFKKQEKTRDPLGRAMMALAAVAFLLFLVALFYVLRLQAPGGVAVLSRAGEGLAKLKRFPAVVLSLFATLCLLQGGGGFVRALAEPPATAATPESTPAEEPTPRANKPLNFSLPLAIGDPASKVRIPQYGDVGQLLSLLNSISVKRLDENRLELQGTDLDLNKPDGKTDFHIRLPKAIFDTRTRILTSLEPVVVSTTDFDLQGERMEFDTGARSGRLMGWVYMKIHNSKSAIGSPEKPSRPAPTPAVSP